MLYTAERGTRHDHDGIVTKRPADNPRADNPRANRISAKIFDQL